MEKRAYEDAILILERLRPKFSAYRPFHDASSPHIVNMTRFLQRCGLSLDCLDRFSVIHVSGTKGKGSTCALTESILRNLGIRTGLLTKPHLQSYRERIRLNGDPIPKIKFTECFWEVYDKLNDQKQDDSDMPIYSMFINIMAFNLFLKEDVDVAIIEVGAGGEYDSTNVLRAKTVGIASLGLDHLAILGQSLRDIAWQKSGIIKPGSSAFSNPQYDECIPVLLSRAHEREATLRFVPKFSDYEYHDKNVLSEITSNPTKVLNSSLAIQLSYDWIRRNPNKITNKSVLDRITYSDDYLTLPREVAEALMTCCWNGRFEVVRYKGFTFHIDTAHTMESIEICTDWFKSKTKLSENKKLLIFNMTNGRDYCRVLDLIDRSVNFDEAFFVPNISSLSSQPLDNRFCLTQANSSQNCAKYWSELSSEHKSRCFGCISDLMDHLHKVHGHREINILVCGCVAIAAAVLNTLEKKISF